MKRYNEEYDHFTYTKRAKRRAESGEESLSFRGLKGMGNSRTRLLDYIQTLRSSYHKNGERNIIQNIVDGNGYEGIIEIWKIISENK